MLEVVLISVSLAWSCILQMLDVDMVSLLLERQTSSPVSPMVYPRRHAKLDLDEITRKDSFTGTLYQDGEDYLDLEQLL